MSYCRGYWHQVPVLPSLVVTDGDPVKRARWRCRPRSPVRRSNDSAVMAGDVERSDDRNGSVESSVQKSLHPLVHVNDINVALVRAAHREFKMFINSSVSLKGRIEAVVPEALAYRLIMLPGDI